MDISLDGQAFNDGSWLFKSSIGSSQTRVVKVIDLPPGTHTVTISITSDAFTAGPFVPGGTGGTFTITFNPGSNVTGTWEGELKVDCGSCALRANLEGAIPVSGVANSLPTTVSISVTPNPATDNVNILTTGARKAEIGIYDLLGKELVSQKTTDWKLNAASIPPGAYIVRVAGESNTGEAFLRSKRVVISR